MKEIAWFSRGTNVVVLKRACTMKFLVITALVLVPLGLAMMLVGRDLARNQSHPIRRHSEGIESWQRRLKVWVLRKRVGARMITIGGFVGLGLSTILVVAGLIGQFGGY